MPRKIIIDTDPGQDDAVALLLALASAEDVEVLAVVTVAGNVPLSHTTANARQVLELAGRPDRLTAASADAAARGAAKRSHSRAGSEGRLSHRPLGRRRGGSRPPPCAELLSLGAPLPRLRH